MQCQVAWGIQHKAGETFYKANEVPPCSHRLNISSSVTAEQKELVDMCTECECITETLNHNVGLIAEGCVSKFKVDGGWNDKALVFGLAFMGSPSSHVTA
ncbi:hypothetical protein Q7C36_020056 [Tachysurus vachellii]|uniref:Uncharacterized protein n=1 Tax=Tachysurus vachellii TaxID=175792 RepID=A0AA88RXH8_TACVA|nr:hypothetical protein Q7C36_020056 [Tachysurus vachellii]